MLHKAAHATHPLTSHVTDEQRVEPVAPVAHGLMAIVDPAFGLQVLDVV
ncbi:hypothetical protein [Erythrobacter mangrovi]|uniref:Uncharacterized protein n=1 Tax=Erythrobacter mangrovi TaxID=2739433 RepID=A0A7D4BC77_9SPHN|nr:hypothetical protein [Erythrobacter mangrovi]QKG72566.1 hypothetical protein HQR01_15000 [Erythrobacter mangrovi]